MFKSVFCVVFKFLYECLPGICTGWTDPKVNGSGDYLYIIKYQQRFLLLVSSGLKKDMADHISKL